MTPAEVNELIALLSDNPLAGVVIPGTGGCRKLRVAGKQRGKSGGFRTVTFYSGANMPVFLLTVLSKGERANFTKAELNALSGITQAIVEEYRARVRKVEAK
jgi:hypothetical protein